MIVNILTDTARALPLYFATLSTSHPQENVSRPAGLRLSQLLFVTGGEGMLSYNGREYRLHRGSAFFIDSGAPHSYVNLGGLVTAWVSYLGSARNGLHSLCKNVPFIFYESVDVDRYIARLEKIQREYLGARREGNMSAALYSLITAFFEEDKHTVDSGIDRIAAYMESCFREKITVDSLAAMCHLSKSAFCKKFKERFGVTAFEKLMEIRLQNADMMLKLHPDDKIYEIATECGFSDVGYFCKAYKKRFGITPTEAKQ